MFNFFKKKSGKEANSAEDIRQMPSDGGNSEAKENAPVEPRVSRTENDVTTEIPVARKDVVNFLIPTAQYNQTNQKTGVGAFLQAMAGKRKKNKRNRTESVRISPPKEMKTALQRSESERRVADVTPPAKNTPDNEHSEADFVKSLVLQKYAKPHVSLVYVSNDSLDEKPTVPDREAEKTTCRGTSAPDRTHYRLHYRQDQ
ncbi:hypothetical protein O0L34_g6646 [Tuta absoluta]|nr:hypothetical protein O0L34_g6646 [Tuta absoluta]